jgi:hypothetical protein
LRLRRARDLVGVPRYVVGLANFFSRCLVDAAKKLALSVR